MGAILSPNNGSSRKAASALNSTPTKADITHADLSAKLVAAPKSTSDKVAPAIERQRGRPGLSSLPLPPERFDLANVDTFETAEKAEAEDRQRAKALRRQANKYPKRARRLRRLADRIDPDVTPHPTTPASSRYMRDQRRRILGAVWQLFDAPRA